MIHAISLAAILFGIWLLLSGHYTPLLLGIGGLSAILAVVVAFRMDVVDHEGHPLRLGLRILAYWPWLAWQIVRANLDVSRTILSPSLPISPEAFPFRSGQQTELAQVIFANSITLTPGTVTVAEENGELVVHALTRQGADDIRSGAMDRKVTALEGRP
ncbi:MAG: Na+/H+ antiporter subunit E [Proteobacteria bacterium]|nr:Na+/H+ antiporter subunit E [Pseudomonadota bacterium]MDA1132047.1 Na+/H+ antiporter subunit E [Pseudomonadota bacterium]